MPEKDEFAFQNEQKKPGARPVQILVVVLSIVVVLLSLGLFFFVSGSGIAVTPGEVRAAIAGQMYQILFLLVVLGGSVGAVAYWVMRKDLTAQVEVTVDAARERVLEDADAHILSGSRLAEARAYIGMSHAIFSHYYKSYRDFVNANAGERDRQWQDRLRREIALGKEISRLALENFEKPPLKELRNSYPSEKHGAELAFHRYHMLMGHVAFHYAVDHVVAQGGEFSSAPETADGDYEFALRCAKRARLGVDWAAGEPFESDWYDTLENCGLCLALSPRVAEQAEGKGILCRLITNSDVPEGDNIESTTVQWRHELWEEYNHALDLGLEEPRSESDGDELEPRAVQTTGTGAS